MKAHLNSVLISPIRSRVRLTQGKPDNNKETLKYNAVSIPKVNRDKTNLCQKSRSADLVFHGPDPIVGLNKRKRGAFQWTVLVWHERAVDHFRTLGDISGVDHW